MPRPGPEELRRVAATMDMFAACLDAGLAPATALTICAHQPTAPPDLASELRRTAAVLALGGDHEAAWRTDHPNLARLMDKLMQRQSFIDTKPH